MAKWIIGAIVVILLLGAGYYFSQNALSPEPQEQQPLDTTPPPPQSSTYSTSTFSVQYPPSYTVDANYAYQGVPNKPIAGVKFVIPGDMATGTNLSTDSGVSVESLPRAKSCTGDIFVYENVKAATVAIGSRSYSVASTTGAGAGNFYEEQVYAIPDSVPCTAVRYFIHSTNIGNYPEGAVREYDRAALLSDFDKIRDSITLTH